MQSRLIVNDKKKHFLFINFINTIHHENFIINFENELRIFLWKKVNALFNCVDFFKKRRISLHYLIDAWKLVSKSWNRDYFYVIKL
jgi:hypothetical protein